MEGKIMKEQEVLKIINKLGALITGGHLVYTSGGKHGVEYVDKDAIYSHTKETSMLCGAIAVQFMDDEVQIVIAPAIGGVKLSGGVAEHLTKLTSCDVLSIYAEKEKIAIPDPEKKGRKCFAETGNFTILRGYDKLISSKNILVVEDVLNTGGSAKKVINAVQAIGGNVVGLGVIWNRGGIKPQDVANITKLIALVNIKLETLSEEECNLFGPCFDGIPINTEVGKGREFLERKGKIC
jgi:orotate phosphoribosyltransferase